MSRAGSPRPSVDLREPRKLDARKSGLHAVARCLRPRSESHLPAGSLANNCAVRTITGAPASAGADVVVDGNDAAAWDETRNAARLTAAHALPVHVSRSDGDAGRTRDCSLRVVGAAGLSRWAHCPFRLPGALEASRQRVLHCAIWSTHSEWELALACASMRQRSTPVRSRVALPRIAHCDSDGSGIGALAG